MKDESTKAPQRARRASSFELVVLVGPAVERRKLPAKGTVVIGRGDSADIQVSDPSLSRHHARIQISREACSIEDLGSSNGTEVGGKRLGKGETAPLAESSVAILGDVA